MEPQVNSKHKVSRKTRNIAVLVLIGIVLLSTLLYFTITRVSDKADNIQSDQAMVQEFQDQLPDEPDLGSSSQDIQTEQTKVSEKPVAKKEVKPAQSPVEAEKQPDLINLTGRWLTDENLEWKIIQKGDEVEITRYNKKGNPTIVQGWINGNTLSYKKSKPGNDIEGEFTISKDGQSLDGVEYKVAGIKNRLKITRLP
jgi:hypothetical protein